MYLALIMQKISILLINPYYANTENRRVLESVYTTAEGKKLARIEMNHQVKKKRPGLLFLCSTIRAFSFCQGALQLTDISGLVFFTLVVALST